MTQTGNTGLINFFNICGSKDKIWIDRAASSVGDNPTPFRFTGKERDPETGLVYFGARYLDPKTSRWLSGDPALGEYVPLAPLGENKRKHNSNLPGMGGVYNLVNLHVYHYAGNNPVKYVDPDGRIVEWEQGEGVTDDQMRDIKADADKLMNSDTEAGRRFKELHDKKDVKVTIKVVSSGGSNAVPGKNRKVDWDRATNGKGTNSIVNIDLESRPSFTRDPKTGIIDLAHEVSGHAYDYYKGKSPYHGTKDAEFGSQRKILEQNAVAFENEVRSYLGLPNQRSEYGGGLWEGQMPRFRNGVWYNNRGLWKPY